MIRYSKHILIPIFCVFNIMRGCEQPPVVSVDLGLERSGDLGLGRETITATVLSGNTTHETETSNEFRQNAGVRTFTDEQIIERELSGSFGIRGPFLNFVEVLENVVREEDWRGIIPFLDLAQAQSNGESRAPY